MQVLGYERLRFLRKVFAFGMDDVFPYPAKGRISVQVFIDLRILQFPDLLKQLFVILAEWFGIDELGQVDRFNFSKKFFCSSSVSPVRPVR